MSSRPSFPSINIGDAPTPLVCGPLTRTQFVRYAGASHDFNPNHHDEVYAKASGNKAVFGMGMLAGGYCARLLTDWLGDGALRGLRIRFASRFWPGDVLTCSAAVTGSVSRVAGPRPSRAHSTARNASRPCHTAEPSSPSSQP